MDPAASELAVEYYERAIRFARSVFPREDDIEGVATERLCWAASQWVEREYQGEFWPWAMGFLRYKLYDWWRIEYGRHMTSHKRKQLGNIPIDDWVHSRGRNKSGEPLTIVDIIPAEVTDPEEQAIGVLQAEFIIDLLNRRIFSNTERRAMELRAQGLTLMEIGEELNFTESRACQIIAKSRAKLERYME